MKPEKLKNKKAPELNINNSKGNKVVFKDFKEKYLVLYFYPKDDTPGCTIEANDFTSLAKDFKKLDTKIIGVSKDDKRSHCKFIDKHELKIELLSDPDHILQDKYGVWQEKNFMGNTFMGTVRTTFIINEKRKIIKVYSNVKAKDHAKNVLEFITHH